MSPTRWRRRALALVGALGAVGVLGASLAGAPAQAAGTPVAAAVTATTVRASGLTWSSGVALPGHMAGSADAFAAWRGRPLDAVVDFTGRRTWQDITSPQWLLAQREHSSVATLVLSTAMLPDDPSVTMAGCAAGTYDDRWRELGATLAASGLADRLVVRLGWELNGNWQKWSATDPAAFVACWRHAHDAVESRAPAVRWEWSVNRGVGQGLPDARRAYPGDAYVDVVGLSSYDVFPAVVDEATWRQHWAGEYGLNWWAAFAAEHGKPVAVSEWRSTPGGATPGPTAGTTPTTSPRCGPGSRRWRPTWPTRRTSTSRPSTSPAPCTDRRRTRRPPPPTAPARSILSSPGTTTGPEPEPGPGCGAGGGRRAARGRAGRRPPRSWRMDWETAGWLMPSAAAASAWGTPRSSPASRRRARGVMSARTSSRTAKNALGADDAGSPSSAVAPGPVLARSTHQVRAVRVRGERARRSAVAAPRRAAACAVPPAGVPPAGVPRPRPTRRSPPASRTARRTSSAASAASPSAVWAPWNPRSRSGSGSGSGSRWG